MINTSRCYAFAKIQYYVQLSIKQTRITCGCTYTFSRELKMPLIVIHVLDKLRTYINAIHKLQKKNANQILKQKKANNFRCFF